jgi:hypothetical protein
VFEHVLPMPFAAGGRVALFAWGDTSIEFSDISTENNIDPSDLLISNLLESFDRAGVYKIWMKALDRRTSDPDGAITSARSLLESVCKLILETNNQTYPERAELPSLYHSAASILDIAPNQQTDATLKSMLGSSQQVVNRLGELRNRVGDAHGTAVRMNLPRAAHTCPKS